MKTYTFLAFLFAFVLVSTSIFVAPAPAQAACSYNGYSNSRGNCAASFPSNWNYSYLFQNRYYEFRDESLLTLIEHLQEIIFQLENQLDESGQVSDVEVTTRAATSITDDSATLRGRVELNNENESEVYFEYGTSRTNLNKETNHQIIEDSDNSFSFEEIIRNLSDNTTYYYRAVAKDTSNDRDFGLINSFHTDDSQSNEPILNTLSAREIEDTSAELNGFVDMNEFNNGRVFFVYGEDQSAVADIEDDYLRYNDIEEIGDNLQKTLVDTDLDSSVTYQENVTRLDSDTRIYYSICVEYEDTDDDDIITCGDVKSFETDK